MCILLYLLSSDKWRFQLTWILRFIDPPRSALPDAVTVPQAWARVRYPVVASTGADVQEAVIGGLPGHWRRITHLVGSAAESHPRDPHPCGLEPAQDSLTLYITFISWNDRKCSCNTTIYNITYTKCHWLSEIVVRNSFVESGTLKLEELLIIYFQTGWVCQCFSCYEV